MMHKRINFTKLLVTGTVSLLLSYPFVTNAGKCTLNLRLRFPNRRPDHVDEFYSSDTMLIEMRRPGDQTLTDEVCSSSNKKTRWGCTHKGEAFVEFDEHGQVGRGEQNVKISKAAGKNFIVQVRHQFAHKEAHQEPPMDKNSVDMRSLFKVSVNGNNLKKTLKPPRNIGIPTHNVEDAFEYDDEGFEIDQSGYINPAYRGTYFANIECDDDCNCTMKRQKLDKCEVTAKLLPEPQRNWARDESLAVHKEGSKAPPCSINDPETWYCVHYSDAKAWGEWIADDAILIKRQAEAIKISNASASTYAFTIVREKSPDDFGVDMNPFRFYIYTPHHEFGPLSLVEAGATFSVKTWGLNCDKDCNCDKPFELPSI